MRRIVVEKWLRSFYSRIVIEAIINMKPHDLSVKILLSFTRNYVWPEVEVGVSYSSIEADNSEELASFNMYLEVDSERLEAIPVGVNLLVLMMSIVDGYRPNKYDKNSVVLLDNLITKITEISNSSDVLYLYKGADRIKLKKNLDNEIRVSGL